MYGPILIVDGVKLRPMREPDLPVLAECFDDMLVSLYLNGTFAKSLKNEIDWLEKEANNPTSVLWGVEFEGQLVGTTAISNMDFHMSGFSGVAIFKKEFWSKGVTSRAHLARTYFAADFLNRHTIVSHVRNPNEYSRRAIEKVGYIKTGKECRTIFRQGKFIDTDIFTWINPMRVDTLFPEGLPEELKEGVQKADIALKKAREVVTFKI